MGINVNNDYSSLFSSLSSTTSNASNLNTFSLSDYASLKNGSYFKLSKAYYEKKENGNTTSSSASDTEKKNLTTIQRDSDSLKESADQLLENGSNNLFEKKAVTKTDSNQVTTSSLEYDKKAIYKGVSAFIDDYNSLIDSGSSSNNSKILRQTLSSTTLTNAFSKQLSDVGISIGSDNKLSIDEKTFLSSNMSTIKTLFHGTDSYAYDISSKASQINYYADNALTKSGTYNANGAIDIATSSGNLYNNYL